MIINCGPFAQSAVWNCSTPTFSSSTCSPNCTCQPGAGMTPLPSALPCDGRLRGCNSLDIFVGCGSNALSCMKMCQWGYSQYPITGENPSNPTDTPAIMNSCLVLPNTCIFNTTKGFVNCTQPQWAACGPLTSNCQQPTIGNVLDGNPVCTCSSGAFKSTIGGVYVQCDVWFQLFPSSVIGLDPSQCAVQCGVGWMAYQGCQVRRWVFNIDVKQAAGLAIQTIFQYNLMSWNTFTLTWTDNMNAVQSYANNNVLAYPYYTTYCQCDGNLLRAPIGSQSPPILIPGDDPQPVTWLPPQNVYQYPNIDYTSQANVAVNYYPYAMDPIASGGWQTTTGSGGSTPAGSLATPFIVYPQWPQFFNQWYTVWSCIGPGQSVTPSFPTTLAQAENNQFEPSYYSGSTIPYDSSTTVVAAAVPAGAVAYPTGFCGGLGLSAGLTFTPLQVPIPNVLQQFQSAMSSWVQSLPNIPGDFGTKITTLNYAIQTFWFYLDGVYEIATPQQRIQLMNQVPSQYQNTVNQLLVGLDLWGLQLWYQLYPDVKFTLLQWLSVTGLQYWMQIQGTRLTAGSYGCYDLPASDWCGLFSWLECGPRNDRTCSGPWTSTCQPIIWYGIGWFGQGTQFTLTSIPYLDNQMPTLNPTSVYDGARQAVKQYNAITMTTTTSLQRIRGAITVILKPAGLLPIRTMS